jgi:hypothetical protein
MEFWSNDDHKNDYDNVSRKSNNNNTNNNNAKAIFKCISSH